MNRPPSAHPAAQASLTITETLACPGCDLIQRVPPLPAGGRARCVRCRETLACGHTDPLDRPLALALASALVFVVANATPVLGLSAVGRHASTTLIGAALQMWQQDQALTALVVALCTVVAPGAYIALLLTILFALRQPPAPHWIARLLRWVEVVAPWSMNAVMMLGVLVALIKIAQLATVIPGVGLYAVLVLIVLLTATTASFDARTAWQRIRWVDGSWPAADAQADVQESP